MVTSTRTLSAAAGTGNRQAALHLKMTVQRACHPDRARTMPSREPPRIPQVGGDNITQSSRKKALVSGKPVRIQAQIGEIQAQCRGPATLSRFITKYCISRSCGLIRLGALRHSPAALVYFLPEAAASVAICILTILSG